MKAVLDACCGSSMFWFDAKDPRALFVDCRKMKMEAIWKSGNGRATRYCTVDPDLVADFRALPFPNESFWHVVFDPPHLLHVGDNAWMAKKYGKLPGDWRPLIHDGFHECMRVLRQFGTLIFKWNEYNIPVRDVIDAIGVQPMYGHKSGKQSKTHWDVWEYLNGKGLPHCSLYDDGFRRIGCVCCPLAPGNMRRDAERWPKTAAMLYMGHCKNWEKAVAAGGITTRGKPYRMLEHGTPRAAFEHWLDYGVTLKSPRAQDEEPCLFAGTGFSESDGEAEAD